MSKQVNVKAYPKDFKEQVVKLAQVGDRSATQIARERAAQQGPGRAGTAAARGSAATHGAGDPVKSRGLVRSGDRLDSVRIYEFVRAHQAHYPITCMCRVLA